MKIFDISIIIILLLFSGLNCNHAPVKTLPAMVPAHVQVNFSVVDKKIDSLEKQIEDLKQKTQEPKTGLVHPITNTIDF